MPSRASARRPGGSACACCREPTATGYIVARNRLVAAADAELVLLLDDDARLLTAEAVERAIDTIVSRSRVSAPSLSRRPKRTAVPGRRPCSPRARRSTSWCQASSGLPICSGGRRLQEIGGYRESFGFYGEEKDFCLRLLEAGYVTVYLPEALVAHVPDGIRPKPAAVSAFRLPQRLSQHALQRSDEPRDLDAARALRAVFPHAHGLADSRSLGLGVAAARARHGFPDVVAPTPSSVAADDCDLANAEADGDGVRGACGRCGWARRWLIACAGC